MAKPAQFLEIDPSSLPPIEALLRAYPRYLRVRELPLDGAGDDDKLEFANVLDSFDLLAIW
jgi:hypothetical protein